MQHLYRLKLSESSKILYVSFCQVIAGHHISLIRHTAYEQNASTMVSWTWICLCLGLGCGFGVKSNLQFSILDDFLCMQHRLIRPILSIVIRWLCNVISVIHIHVVHAIVSTHSGHDLSSRHESS